MFVGGLFLVALGLWLLLLLDSDANGHAPTILAIVVFLSIVVDTFVAAALSAAAGGGIVHSLAVGLVPGVVIVLAGLGRDMFESGPLFPELGEVVLVFSVLGLVGIALALAGFVAVGALNWLGSAIARPNR